MRILLKKILNTRAVYFFILGLKHFWGRSLLLCLVAASIIGYTWYILHTLSVLQSQMVHRITTCAQRIHELPFHVDGQNTPQFETAFLGEGHDIPIIMIDTAGNPVYWANLKKDPWFFERAVHQSATFFDGSATVAQQAKILKKQHAPILLWQGGSGIVIGYIVYGTSRSIIRLAGFSAVMGFVFFCFIGFLYFSLHTIRINERSSLWVALAKETAHQLGTPISALMGWVEYLRSTKDAGSELDPATVVDQIDKICGDMEHDLDRLIKISSRFSQIGSVPALSPCKVNEILADVMAYFSIRLPVLKRRIEITRAFADIPLVNVNRELLEWVFENLMKNSVDALQRESGHIEIKTEFFPEEKVVRIYHSDNGNGISREVQKTIFSPGYTTKKRGWGLGLTLAKRIVEDYHSGRIYVQWSKKDQGTIFCVELPCEKTTEATANDTV